MTREEVLVPWLKEQGLYEQFMANLEKSWEEEGTQPFLSRDISPIDIECAFVWANTKEDFQFWNDISEQWEWYYQSISQKEG